MGGGIIKILPPFLCIAHQKKTRIPFGIPVSLVRDEGLTACHASLTGCFLASLLLGFGPLAVPGSTGASLYARALSGSSPFDSMHTRKKREYPSVFPFLWCAMRDLNPHGRPLDPKSSASANSANRADFTYFI